MSTEIPIRTYSMNHKDAGYIEISVPIMNPVDSEEYLRTKLADVPLQERLKLHGEVMKQATFMWDAFSLYVGDAEAARLELRKDDEVMRKCLQV